MNVCRAVALGLQLPDPTDPACPIDIKKALQDELVPLQISEPIDDITLKRELLDFVERVSRPGIPVNQNLIAQARRLVRVSGRNELPLLLDPFAGGGSIPLEGLRLGMEVWASDINPVAHLMLKSLLKTIPNQNDNLLSQFRQSSVELMNQVREELSGAYSGDNPVAYIWAREVVCESPDCGIRIPLVNNMWLRKKRREGYFAFSYDVRQTDGTSTVHVEPRCIDNLADIQKPTISGAKVTCPNCHRTLSADRVQVQLSLVRGGASQARLIAVVENSEDGRRTYRLPKESDFAACEHAVTLLEALSTRRMGEGGQMIPNEKLPPQGTLGFRVQRYGLTHWRDLFLDRQLLLLLITAKRLRELNTNEDVRLLLAIALSKCVRHWNTGAKWHSGSETVAGAFGMQTVPMSWMWPEEYPWTKWAGGFQDAFDALAAVIENGRDLPATASVGIADAADHPLPDESVDIWFTDPPYYDAIPYADLSDFFLVWLKRFIPPEIMPRDPFDKNNPLSPKSRECVVNPARDQFREGHDESFFETQITKAFSEGRRVLKENGIGCVVFAHKSTEGWEALLSGIVNSGWVVTASWPIDTERGARLRARQSAVLSSSIHIILRPRPENAAVGEWTEVINKLPKCVGDWMERLHNEGVRGADMVFACIGPALELYSRYSRVETAEGRAIELPEYLIKVWEVVGRKALENILGTAEARARNGAAGALEEDARLTALFLWTLQGTATNGNEGTEDDIDNSDDEGDNGTGKQIGGYSLIFDVARRFCQPLGIDLPKWEGRIVETEKGVVRLLAIHERAKQLFGEDGAQAMADRIEDRQRGPVQMRLFPEEGAKPPEIEGMGRERKAKKRVSNETLKTRHEATTLDKVHAAMLLQDSGRTNALRALIEAEQQRGPEFMRLANALSALYPPKSEEKRLLDAMILSAPR